MMISPESEYQEYLKDKSVSQIMLIIRGLKHEIERLQRALENPCYETETDPSETVQLSCMQQSLERAKQALIDAGGIYIPTKE